jgi:hypothetical protein
MWTALRKEIEKIRIDFLLKDSQFKPIGLGDWQSIENKLLKAFCKSASYKSRPAWLWECFKLDTYSVRIEKTTNLLEKLIDNDEDIFFFVNDTISELNKFWYYTGKISYIQTVINESCNIDEMYFASKKYDWLICINHHNFLIATGKTMTDRLKKL